MTEVEFKPWPKIQRMKGLTVTITEKIDGTNSCVIVDRGEVVGCQSRQRLIKVGDDNYGFAFWAEENKDLLAQLGDGYHYGEWAGPGIQKNPHQLEEKTFFLFNTFRPQESLPAIVKQVPILYVGDYSSDVVDGVIEDLRENGSKVGGKPEGIITYFHDSRSHLKWTFEYQDGKWKGK